MPFPAASRRAFASPDRTASSACADRRRQGAVPRQGALGGIRGLRCAAGLGAGAERRAEGDRVVARERALPRDARPERRRRQHLSTSSSARNCSRRPCAWRSRPTRRGNGRRGTWISTRSSARPAPTSAGPRRSAIVENGPVRVAVEVTREAEGSKFVQTVRLSAGDAGNRVEFANAIDWKTLASNVKAVFPLAASNRLATYNWDIGTIQRPTAEERQFEVASHQWIDLTDQGGQYGATILTDCKNGSDKRDDHTIRLTLIRTPGFPPPAANANQGFGGGRGRAYSDQFNQDWGHHEFVFGIAGHAGDWRDGQTDWQAYRLNQPLDSFRNREARRGARQGVFAGDDRQSAHSPDGAEEGRDERRNDPPHGGDGWEARAERAREVRRTGDRRPRSERPGAAGRPRHGFRRSAGHIVHGVSAAHLRAETRAASRQSAGGPVRAGHALLRPGRRPATTTRRRSAASMPKATRFPPRCCPHS